MVINEARLTGALHRIGQSAPLTLTNQVCCLCDVEDAEPLAVGEDFEYRTSPDTFVALRCRRCELIYLSPRPAVNDLDRIYPPDYHAFQFSAENFGLAYKVRRWLEAKRLLACCQGLPDDARILDVGCGDGFHLSLLKQFGEPSWTLEGLDASVQAVGAARRSGLIVHQGTVQSTSLPRESFDLVFLIATIEHVENPVDVLFSVRNLLKVGGRAVIVTDNTETTDFRLFGSRHWGGYHFPRHWNLFNEATLRRLAAITTLNVDRIETIVSPVNWVYSFRNLLQDQGAPQWLVNQFSLKTPLTLGAFTLLDSMYNVLGKGALLRATLRKSQ